MGGCDLYVAIQFLVTVDLSARWHWLLFTSLQGAAAFPAAPACTLCVGCWCAWACGWLTVKGYVSLPPTPPSRPRSGARIEEFLYEKLDRKIPSRTTNGELLGQYMLDAAKDFGPGTPYGE